MNAHPKVSGSRRWPSTADAVAAGGTWDGHAQNFIFPTGSRQWPQRVGPSALQWSPPVRGKRVAIVGNAPTALLNTEDIDAYDYVVRFNRFQLGEGFEMLGTRTDFFCTSVGGPTLEWFGECGAQAILDSTPRTDRPKWCRDHDAQVAGLQRALPGVGMIDAGLTTDRVRAGIGRMPTSGLVAIARFLELQPAELYLTGFSFEKGTQHYFADQSFNHEYHDVEAERLWLASRAGTPYLRFDDHIRRRLEAPAWQRP